MLFFRVNHLASVKTDDSEIAVLASGDDVVVGHRNQHAQDGVAMISANKTSDVHNVVLKGLNRLLKLTML